MDRPVRWGRGFNRAPTPSADKIEEGRLDRPEFLDEEGDDHGVSLNEPAVSSQHIETDATGRRLSDIKDGKPPRASPLPRTPSPSRWLSEASRSLAARKEPKTPLYRPPAQRTFATSQAPGQKSASLHLLDESAQVPPNEPLLTTNHISVSVPTTVPTSVPPPQIESKPVLPLRIGSKPAPPPHIESKPVPPPQIESKPVPAPQIESKPVPAPQIESKPVPSPQTKSKPVAPLKSIHATTEGARIEKTNNKSNVPQSSTISRGGPSKETLIEMERSRKAMKSLPPMTPKPSHLETARTIDNPIVGKASRKDADQLGFSTSPKLSEDRMETFVNTDLEGFTTTTDFESYQLQSDEEYLTESSADSESATSTICDYEEVSDPEKAPKERKVTETETGEVFYAISLNEEPYKPMSFQIPPNDLVRLVALNVNNKNRVWSHALYRHEQKKVEVEYCFTVEQFEIAAQKFLNEKVVGFDMEWFIRPSKNVWDNVSLMQVAKEDYIALFHIARIQKENPDELISQSLRTLLESKDILKAGVHIAGDGGRVKKWLGIDVQGLMELSAIHHLVQHAKERRRGLPPKILISLSKLSDIYLQLPIDKGYVRISDWTKPLNAKQVAYAATDAYAGLRIYDCLEQARKSLDPIPMLPPCVKDQDEKKKKKRVVTPKMYIDGLENGAAPVSTWDIQPDPTTTTSLDWAQEVEEVEERNESKPANTPKRKSKKALEEGAGTGGASKKSNQPAPVPSSPEVEFATEWADKHISNRTEGRATRARLRAYALWHLKSLTVEDISVHLNIKVHTAAQYIVDAVKLDHLPHNTLDMKVVKEYLPTFFFRRGRKVY
ncbi:hypothetical protein BDZ91DRAFT_793346 [Kalaharituber pfeilii]|nr:hypothetical protein BDZ91DRAFT_793346 [Kalaharituber pfeilii]